MGKIPANFKLSGLSAGIVENFGPNNNLQQGHWSASSFINLLSLF
jgi:hypothetical protein